MKSLAGAHLLLSGAHDNMAEEDVEAVESGEHGGDHHAVPGGEQAGLGRRGKGTRHLRRETRGLADALGDEESSDALEIVVDHLRNDELAHDGNR
jgi:hypothetical protein